MKRSGPNGDGPLFSFLAAVSWFDLGFLFKDSRIRFHRTCEVVAIGVPGAFDKGSVLSYEAQYGAFRTRDDV